MVRNKNCHPLVFLILQIVLASASAASDQARLLIVPPTSPTRHQLICGIGIPLGTPESVTSGWVLKAQYFLPTSTDDLKPLNWAGWNDSRRSFEKREVAITTPTDHYESYLAKDVHIDVEPLSEESEPDDYLEDGDDDYWLDEEEEKTFQDVNEMLPPVGADIHSSEGYNAEGSRWVAYKSLEHIGESYGSGGRACVLRSICDAASAQFTHTGGVFAELLHIIFTPSTTAEPLSDHSDNEYYRAEQLGKEGAPCRLVFHECQNSILDVFTGVHDSTTNELSVAHDKVMTLLMK